MNDVKEDLRRRDFTINAICCGLNGELIDPFAGEKDLQLQVIRCVGDAEERFDEDALRMLRCIRFASVLDFSIAKNTWRGLMRQRDKLAHIAVERVRAELDRIVEGPHPLRGLGMLARCELLARGKAPFPWTGTDMAAAAALTAGIGELESARLRWALLLHALKQSAQEADVLLRAWTFSGTTRSGVVQVLRVREAWTAALEGHAAGYGRHGRSAAAMDRRRAGLRRGSRRRVALAAGDTASSRTYSSHCGLFCLFHRGIARGCNLTCRCKCTSGKRMDRANAANQPFGA